jgi:DNA-binding IclR family transcriptional regulator
MRRVGRDCIPPGRTLLLGLLAEASEPRETALLATQAGMPTETARRVLQDLAALKLATRISQGRGNPDLWELTPETATKWKEARL